MKIRSEIDFAEDMKKYSKEQLINKLVSMRSFLLEIIGEYENV